MDRSTRRRVQTMLAALIALQACSYDFDQFAGKAAGKPGSGGSGTGGSGAATSGGSSGTGGGAVSGGSGGGGGTATGGTATGGTATGGSATGGGGAGVGGAAGGAGGSGGIKCAVSTAKVWMGHCYFTVATGTGVSWTAAKTACAGFGNAHLVTIGSAQEQAMIAQSFFPSTTDFWIGLSQVNTSQSPPASCALNPSSCPFVWVTGETVSYTNWGMSGTTQEPNFSGACVRIKLDTHGWADYTCTVQLPAICEQE